jgi:hypothetical protein
VLNFEMLIKHPDLTIDVHRFDQEYISYYDRIVPSRVQQPKLPEENLGI